MCHVSHPLLHRPTHSPVVTMCYDTLTFGASSSAIGFNAPSSTSYYNFPGSKTATNLQLSCGGRGGCYTFRVDGSSSESSRRYANHAFMRRKPHVLCLCSCQSPSGISHPYPYLFTDFNSKRDSEPVINSKHILNAKQYSESVLNSESNVDTDLQSISHTHSEVELQRYWGCTRSLQSPARCFIPFRPNGRGLIGYCG